MPKPQFKSDIVSYNYDILTEFDPEYAKPLKVWLLLDEVRRESDFDLDKAKLAYKEAANLPITWLMLGRACSFYSKYLEAEPFLKKYVQSSFVDSQIYSEYAECLQSLKRYDQALIQYQNAIDWAKENCPENIEDLSEYLTAKAL